MTYHKIDFHAHYLSPGYKKYLKDQFNDMGDGVPTPEYTIDTTLSIMDQVNIDYSVISISSPHINTGEKSSTIELAQEVNEYAAKQHQTYKDKIGFFASLPLPYVEASQKAIKAALADDATGFTLPTNSRGIYLGDKRLDPIMQTLDDNHAIVALHPNAPGVEDPTVTSQIPAPIVEFFFDTTRTVLNMLQNGIFTRYPNIRFIIPHAGAVLPIVAARVQNLTQALNHDLTDDQVNIMSVMSNQYFDVAGMVLPQQLPTLLELIDSNKLLYASDTPYTPTPAVLSLTKQLETTGLLSDALKQRIFMKNGQELLKK